MTAKHTPGPWITNGRAIEQAETTERKETLVIAYAEDEHNEDHVANARLIASAPDLLEALKAIANHARRAIELGDKSPALASILAVANTDIAKAT